MQIDRNHRATPLQNSPQFGKTAINTPKPLQGRMGRKVRHQRPTSEWVGRVISKIGKTAGIVVAEGDSKGKPKKFASAHDLRRSCSKRLRYAGVPPLVISRVMRHSSWETTQKHYAASDVQQDGEIIWEILSQKKSK